MELTNLTAIDYTLSLGGLTLPASGSVTVDDDEYLSDTYLRHTVNALVSAGKASAASAPNGFPVGDQTLNGATAKSWFLFDNPGDDVAPSTGASVGLTWVVNPNFPAEADGGQGGDNPFDLTDPKHPSVLADGNYSLWLNVNVTGNFVTGKRWFAGCDIQYPAGLLLSPGFSRALPVVNGGVFDQIVVGEMFLPAGTVLFAYMGQNLGSNCNCYLTAHVTWEPT